MIKLSAMKISLQRNNTKFHFTAKSESGASIDLDASENIGGEHLGMRPMEVLASSLAGCSSIDILNILYKQKLVIKDYSVEVEATRSEELPGVFSAIHLTIRLVGDIPLEKAQRAADLSFGKYCSVSKMIENGCDISYSVIVTSS
jgi:putative redox protein